jgi:hypothetical protein
MALSLRQVDQETKLAHQDEQVDVWVTSSAATVYRP